MQLLHTFGLIFSAALSPALLGCGGTPRGRYVDANHFYVDFHRWGKAFTNIGAGGSETAITYDVSDDRITLHQIDGNPTLRVEPDQSLCCGPGGALIPEAKQTK